MEYLFCPFVVFTCGLAADGKPAQGRKESGHPPNVGVAKELQKSILVIHTKVHTIVIVVSSVVISMCSCHCPSDARLYCSAIF